MQSIELVNRDLKKLDKEIENLENKLPWVKKMRRRYFTGRMFWATQICDSWGGFKMALLLYLALGQQVFVALAEEYAWVLEYGKSSYEWCVDVGKTCVTFFREVS